MKRSIKFMKDFINENDNKDQNDYNHKMKDEFIKYLNLKLDCEFLELRRKLIALNSSVVFCHNDVNVGNILKIDDQNIMLIDYEYGSYNYRFDFSSSPHFESQ
jgi:thiamine kinase-like enzyme